MRPRARHASARRLRLRRLGDSDGFAVRGQDDIFPRADMGDELSQRVLFADVDLDRHDQSLAQGQATDDSP